MKRTSKIITKSNATVSYCQPKKFHQHFELITWTLITFASFFRLINKTSQFKINIELPLTIKLCMLVSLSVLLKPFGLISFQIF